LALPPVHEVPGSHIGSCKLLQKLGEGGMGTVWVAEQTEPVKRRVALKLIKPGMDSAQVLRRFEAERQALALMDHTNIAKVFDAGTTDSGRPYFVMELVEGVPITKYCDELHLAVRERLQLFIPVCRATQHAHQKGIVHRDLKPTNVLVSMQDGKPVAKVIDFGVAKALHQRLTQETVYTEVGTVVGTLEYMSPEQAEMSPLGVDTRADVYALGVLLYELLTGTTPLDRTRLRSAAYTEMVRIIKEEEPPKPSSRLTRSKEFLASRAAQRRTEPARLTQEVRGDLDAIVMKCLEKDRTRRYETANGLARDIERHLRDEPVDACPPSTGYRLRKLLRKHRVAVLTAAALVALLVLGVVASTWQAVRATRAEGQARAERDAAEHARERADRNSALARDAVEDYLSKVTDNPKLKQSDFHQLRTELLETAMPFFQKLVEQESQDPELRAARGRAYLRLAVLRDEMGDRKTGLGDHERALEIFKLLVAEFPAVTQYRQDFAASEHSFSSSLVELGRWAEAEAHLQKAIAIREKLASDFPAVAAHRQGLGQSHNTLGILLATLGRWAEAETQYRKALATREELAADFPTTSEYHRDVAGALNNLGNCFRQTGKRTEALVFYERAIRYQGQALLRDSQDATSRRFLATHHHNLAELLAELGRRDEVEDHWRKALAIRDKLVTDFPDVQEHVLYRAETYYKIGHVMRNSGQPQEALDWYAKVVAALEPILAKEKRLALARRNLCHAHWGRARGFDLLHRHDKAVQNWERALELDDGNYHPALQLGRAISQAHVSGDHRQALAGADTLARDADGRTLEELARLCALASAAIADEGQEPAAAAQFREQYAARAVDLLRQAAGKGYRDIAYLKEGSDLAPLRHRTDFQKLLAKGEAKRETPGP
jgi:tetratricopeptide (TPR) repeat protein/tRNA A-37 threonylcarbamoyl transferase component Bud32